MEPKQHKTFEDAARECNGIPLEEFIDLLHKRIDELYDKHEAEQLKKAKRKTSQTRDYRLNA